MMFRFADQVTDLLNALSVGRFERDEAKRKNEAKIAFETSK